MRLFVKLKVATLCNEQVVLTVNENKLCVYSFSYCLSSEVTCHPLPGPALPTLLHFHSDLLAFFLKLFQGELHSVSTR